MDFSTRPSLFDWYNTIENYTMTGAINHDIETYYPTMNSWKYGSSRIIDKPFDLESKSAKDVKLERERGPKMNVYHDRSKLLPTERCIVSCQDVEDLSQNKILKNLSIMKSRLMMECAPVFIEKIECKMTPEVKNNIIIAWRKIHMYGKKTPFIARFDEYGNRLTDEVKIDTLHGMTIQIVDPKEYSSHYLEFKAIVLPNDGIPF